MGNFVSYANATSLMTAIAEKFATLNGAYVIKGNSAFANIPATPTEDQTGFVYNITDNFTTDSRFVEGAGKVYSAGTNIVIVDNSTYAAVTPAGSEDPVTEGWYELVDGKYVLSTDETVDAGKTYYAKTVLVQYDVISTFVDVEGIYAAIQAVSDMITAEFDSTAAYAIGDLTVYEGALYTFTSAHTADDPWDSSEVSATTVEDLFKAVYAKLASVDGGLDNLAESLADVFDSTSDYAVGDVVVYGHKLYRFTSAHTANDPWDPAEVAAVTVETLLAEEVTARVNAVAGLASQLADVFDDQNAYAIGDVVVYANGLYKFTAAHTAGDPWDSTEVESVTMESLINAAEPDELTTAQVNTLIGLLD